MIINLAAVPLASHIEFSPTSFNGTELDTGGMLAHYWDIVTSNPDGIIPGKCLKKCLLSVRDMDRGSCFGAYEGGGGLPDVWHNALLHLRRSSMWDLRSKLKQLAAPGDDAAVQMLRDQHAGRWDCLWKFLAEGGSHPEGLDDHP
mmetsp:Transcript_17464/g.42640  ORF Transcript_17464/g.42640 Transcript_17464/m.42640 type:complete len:145 (-) Transcript_17464:456-890(-)